ncbi:MAG: DNA gyrase subunit A [Acetilactobacillus jinshanensis]
MANEDLNNRITNVDLSKRMRSSFLDYAMSVIVARALPDVCDGLKPVQRRILYDMHELGVTPDKPYKKSARVVGDVLGKYHPHGDSAVYGALVRMAQPFSYRYMLVDGHGNFGSIDGDGAAAMRYTEARLSRVSVEMLRDINKDTVKFQDNYDGTEREPVVLPARFPNLLVNGANGIAVGMATNIPPHNLSEVIDGIHMLMHHPDVTVPELMKVIPGPDFPTGGVVIGKSGIRKAYQTGRGTIALRAKVDIQEQKNGKKQIVITQMPYMVNKAQLVKHIANLVREKRIMGITDVNDESDREGLRVVIKVRRDASAQIILNNLYKMTLLQTSFSFNMLAIVNGAPRLLNLKQILQYYLKHQVEVVRRRVKYELTRAQKRDEIMRGLLIALDHIKEIIRIIRSPKTSVIAKARLIDNFRLTDRQAQAILDMRLVRLTGLEYDKIEATHKKLLKNIANYKAILGDPKKVDQIIDAQIMKLKKRFGDKRRTKIVFGKVMSIEDEDLIEPKDVMVTLTHRGYVKRLDTDDFKTQNRGGRGIQGMDVHNDDFVEHLISTNTHDTLLLFTNAGKVYRMKVYQIPEYGRNAKGLPIINFLRINPKERIQAVINVSEKAHDKDKYLFFTTVHGTVKRTPVKDFMNIRRSGLKAIHLKNGDELLNVSIVSGKQNVIIGTHQGYAVTFPVDTVRSMGRGATGVKGVTLRPKDYAVGADVLGPRDDVFVISEKGYGKRTPANQYQVKGRGGKGIKTVNVAKKNGPLSGLTTLHGTEDLMLMTNRGVTIRFSAASVSETSRVTYGVRLIRVNKGSKVSTIAKVPHEDTPEKN